MPDIFVQKPSGGQYVPQPDGQDTTENDRFAEVVGRESCSVSFFNVHEGRYRGVSVVEDPCLTTKYVEYPLTMYIVSELACDKKEKLVIGNRQLDAVLRAVKPVTVEVKAIVFRSGCVT